MRKGKPRVLREGFGLEAFQVMILKFERISSSLLKIEMCFVTPVYLSLFIRWPSLKITILSVGVMTAPTTAMFFGFRTETSK